MQIQDIAEITFQIHHSFLADVTAEAKTGSIPIQQCMLLGFLSDSTGIKMSRLADMMQLTRPAATGLVDRLVDDGFVARFDHPQDRRQVLIRITPKGKSIVDEIRKTMLKQVLAVAGELSGEEFEKWSKIYKIMQNRFPPSPLPGN